MLTGCARVVRDPHVLGKQLPICTEPVSARRCLQTQSKCSTCTSPTQDGSPSTPKRARRAPLSLAPLSLQAYFGVVCGGRVSIKSGSRARGRLLPSRCSYRPSEHSWRCAASTQVFPPGRAAAARGLAAEGRPRPVPRGRRRSRSAQEGAKAQRLGCRLDVPGREKVQLFGSRPRAAGRTVAGTWALGGVCGNCTSHFPPMVAGRVLPLGACRLLSPGASAERIFSGVGGWEWIPG